MSETTEMTATPEPQTKPEYRKLQKRFEHLRATGDIIDPIIAEMGGEIERLAAVVETLQNAERPDTMPDEGNAFPRLAACLWSEIMGALVEQIRTRFSFRGTIRDIEAGAVVDLIMAEIESVKISVARGCGRARYFERLTECMAAVLRRAQQAVEAGERDVDTVAAMLLIGVKP